MRFNITENDGENNHEEAVGEEKQRLHRRDTPHHLKNKRINKQVDKEKVATIIAQALKKQGGGGGGEGDSNDGSSSAGGGGDARPTSSSANWTSSELNQSGADAGDGDANAADDMELVVEESVTLT